MQGMETKSILDRWSGVAGWTLAYRMCVVVFLLLVGRFYETGTGFSSLISIGGAGRCQQRAGTAGSAALCL
jgi:hypothetical protein